MTKEFVRAKNAEREILLPPQKVAILCDEGLRAAPFHVGSDKGICRFKTPFFVLVSQLKGNGKIFVDG